MYNSVQNKDTTVQALLYIDFLVVVLLLYIGIDEGLDSFVGNAENHLLAFKFAANLLNMNLVSKNLSVWTPL